MCGSLIVGQQEGSCQSLWSGLWVSAITSAHEPEQTPGIPCTWCFPLIARNTTVKVGEEKLRHKILQWLGLFLHIRSPCHKWQFHLVDQ